MRFMMFMFPGAKAEAGAMPSADLVGKMMKYNEDLAKAGVLLALDGLHPTAKGAAIAWGANGKPVVRDGPFEGAAGTIVGGYWILQVSSREEAIEWAKRCPSDEAHHLELRQIFELADFPRDVQAAADSAVVTAAIARA